MADVESNIVFFRLAEGMPPVPAVVDRLKAAGVLMITMRGGIRAVTHLQVSFRPEHLGCRPIVDLDWTVATLLI